MAISVAFCFLSLIALALGAPPTDTPTVSVPQGFTFRETAHPEATLELRIALKQNNIVGLIDSLYDVSTPSSANYGKYLSKQEVEALVAPSPDTVDAVTRWLDTNNVPWSTLSSAGDWFNITLPVHLANTLLNADYAVYTHTESGKNLTRTLSYSIPSELVEYIELVHPTTTFAVLNRRGTVLKAASRRVNLTSTTAPSSCADSIMPFCLQEEYGIPSTSASSSSRLAVSGFIDEYANNGDLASFLRYYQSDVPVYTTFSVQTLDGGQNPQGSGEAGVEANLDVQYAVGLAIGVPVTFISVGPNNVDGVDGFLDIINFLLEQTSPPQVLTTSYGFNEATFAGQPSLAETLCNAYAQLGARGVTILFSSGDGGVAGSQSSSCSTFLPTFPSTCPFVTSVGATSGVGTETAADFSSGGFSNIFPAPSYQSAAVQNYLSRLGSTYQGRFNATGRGFPDVALNGVNYDIVVNNRSATVSGTSCSSPSFAAIVALVNAELIAAGKPVLGFLNPFVYEKGADAFTDILSGDNPGCNTDGFSAAQGWDPITGVGTPIFSEILTAVGL